MEDIIMKWWTELSDDNNKGACAELRRALNPDQVYYHSFFHRLRKRLPNKDEEKLALVAGLCSHIKEDTGKSLGSTLAAGERPLMSEARFKRLLSLSEDDPEKLYRELVRVIKLSAYKLPVHDLIKKAYYWNDKTKRDLAKDYYTTITHSTSSEEVN